MEQTLFRVHVRTVTNVCGTLNRPIRIIIEKILLFVAIMSLMALFLVHTMYVSPTAQNCLTLALGNAKIDHTQTDLLYVTLTNDWTTLSIFNVIPKAMSWNVSEFSKNVEWALSAETKKEFVHEVCPYDQMNGLPGNCDSLKEVARFVLAKEKGYLHLSDDARNRHNISTATVYISAQEVCFGPPAYVYLLDAYAGYSTVMKNWGVRQYSGSGFLYNIDTEEAFDMSTSTEFLTKTGNAAPPQYSSGLFSTVSSFQHFIAFKVGILLSTLFLFFTTTTLVSFTLRVTQEKMLKFTFLLQYYVSRGMPYTQLVLTHLVETLVFVPVMIGMMFFLFEFFQDQMLAFLILTTVWLYEVYAAVSLRTAMSMTFFPKIFFVFFSLFHIYTFSFPLGFSYVALASTVIFLAHSMWYFWNYFEVPAFEAGKITAHEPRARPIGNLLAGSELSSMGTVREYQHYRRTEALGRAAYPNQSLFSSPVPMSSSQSRTRRTGEDMSSSDDNNLSQSESSGQDLAGLSHPEEDNLSSALAMGRSRERRSDAAIGASAAVAPRSAKELYEEHVALSKRIQRQQLAAMLGIGLDFDIDNDNGNQHEVGLDIDN